MKELENLKELYLEEIKKITKKGDLSPADSDAACKALGALEKIHDLCKKEKELEYEEHSERMYPGRMNRTHAYGMPEYSERRGRNSMGQYTSRRAVIDSMVDTLESMRSEAPDDETMRTIERCIDGINRR